MEIKTHAGIKNMTHAEKLHMLKEMFENSLKQTEEIRTLTAWFVAKTEKNHGK